VVSKTFTTAETMLNARTVRKWLVDGLVSKKVSAVSPGRERVAVPAPWPLTRMAGIAAQETVCQQHIVAVSADVAKARAFGVAEQNVFGFWDWVRCGHPSRRRRIDPRASPGRRARWEGGTACARRWAWSR
jgi:glucose-6-phosphate isomerase